MKRILLLIAIYSLIIHQSRKNGKQIVPGIQETMIKEITNPAGERSGSIASNKDLQKEITGNNNLYTGLSLVFWKTGR